MFLLNSFSPWCYCSWFPSWTPLPWKKLLCSHGVFLVGLVLVRRQSATICFRCLCGGSLFDFLMALFNRTTRSLCNIYVESTVDMLKLGGHHGCVGTRMCAHASQNQHLYCSLMSALVSVLRVQTVLTSIPPSLVPSLPLSCLSLSLLCLDSAPATVFCPLSLTLSLSLSLSLSLWLSLSLELAQVFLASPSL